MTALANQHQAINLAQGFPDFDPDPLLDECVTEALKLGKHQYQPMTGHPELIARTANMVSQNLDITVPAAQLTITAGATQAIFTAISAMVFPGDEAIVFTPAYDCYEPAIKLNGGDTRHCALNAQDFSVDWDLFASLCSEKTRLVIINSPHNPTGTIWQHTDFEQLGRFAEKFGFYVISDEVYDHVNFSLTGHLSVLHFPELASRSFVVGSFGKILHLTGWKIGYCLAPDALSAEFRKVHQFNVFSVNSLCQQALATYLSRTDLPHTVTNMYRQKRDFFRQLLQPSRFRLLPCDGTYFQVVDYSAISNGHDVDFARRLTIEHGVASIPLSVFSSNDSNEKFVRLCFAKKDETLSMAGKILSEI